MDAKQFATYKAGLEARDGTKKPASAVAPPPPPVPPAATGSGPNQFAAVNAAAKTGEPTVDNKLRTDWNAYLQWLDKKGLKGHQSLDKNDLGGQMIDQYRKENPATSVSREAVVPLQKDFKNYRAWVLDNVVNKKLVNGKKQQLAPGTTPENFMTDLSDPDGISGQFTTRHSFPEGYLTSFENGKNKGTVNTGFSTLAKN